MFLKWLIATGIILLQEVVTLNTLLYKAHTGLYSIVAIHVVFVLATIFDIWIGYRIGLWTKRKFTKGRLVNFAEKMALRFNTKIGTRGRKVALFLLGMFSFPYVNSFIAAWLGLPFWEMFGYLFVGNVINYAISWILVLGVSTVIPNPSLAGLAIVGVTVLGVLILRKYESKI